LVEEAAANAIVDFLWRFWAADFASTEKGTRKIKIFGIIKITSVKFSGVAGKCLPSLASLAHHWRRQTKYINFFIYIENFN
jgi:hypothetical protein